MQPEESQALRGGSSDLPRNAESLYSPRPGRPHVEWLDGANSDGAVVSKGNDRGDTHLSMNNNQGSQAQRDDNPRYQPRANDPRANDPRANDPGLPTGDSMAVRIPCPDCGRKFNEIALAKHTRVCKNVFMKKRKPVNLTAARLGDAAAAQGVELSAVSGGAGTVARGRPPRGGAPTGRAGGRAAGAGKRPQAGVGNKKASWKVRSQQLRQAMQANRPGVGGGASSAMPAEPDPSMVQCPHCQRTFSDIAAERHIPQCSNIKAKPKRLMRGTGNKLGVASRGAASRRH